MATGNQIRYLRNEMVDTSKWDRCIDNASNGLIYSYSFYLNKMSRNWDALVLNDYEAVMPITWNKKYGFFYLYQPFLCACLGIFGNNLNAAIVESFLKAVPGKFRYWDIYLNYGNLFQLKNFSPYQRINHTLSLNKSYKELYTGFRTSYKQLLKKFETSGSKVLKNIPVKEVMVLAKAQLDPLFNIKEEDYENFESLYEEISRNGAAINYGVYSSNGELLASGLFLFSHKRAYYILAGNHPNGRTLGASHQVVHSFIRDYCGQDLVLDFEGSGIYKIAFFFKGFGAQEELYPGIIYNRLPALLKWLKT